MAITLPGAVTRTASRQTLRLRKYSPQILFGVGVVGTVATVVVACRATLRMQDELADLEKQKVNAVTEKEIREVKTKTVRKFVEVDSPAVGLGVVSIAALSGSHRIMSKRNAGLSAAYATLDRAFREYEKRVVDELGEEKARELKFGVREEEIEIEGRNGPKKQVVRRAEGASQYARFFGEYDGEIKNGNWNHIPEYNWLFLQAKQRELNSMLAANGHLFLNDVYDHLGLSRTPGGSQVGWLWNKGSGDQHVDFGIWSDFNAQRIHEFLTSDTGEILLDFNVDGEIWREI